MNDLEELAGDGGQKDPNPDEQSSDAAPVSPFADLQTV